MTTTTTAPDRPRTRPVGRRRRARSRWLALAAGLVALAVLAVLSVAVGSRPVPLDTVRDALAAFDATLGDHLIVRELRIPRTLLGVLVGAALGVAGAVMQAVTRNPLAEPGLLGVNAGASVAVVVAIAWFGVTTPAGYLWFALAGAAGASVLVFGLGGAFGTGSDPVRLVLAGAALSVVFGAFTHAVTISYPDVFASFRFWTVGSLEGRGWAVLLPTAVVVGAGLVLAQSLSGALDVTSLGADLSRAVGASARRTWVLGMVAVVLLAGGATAAAGPIAFVGLAAPHVARLVVGPAHRWIVAFSGLLGALVLLASDVVGRVVAFPSEVQTGIVSALVGGPLFVALVRRRRIAQL